MQNLPLFQESKREISLFWTSPTRHELSLVTNFVFNEIDKELDDLLQPQSQCSDNDHVHTHTLALLGKDQER